MPKEVATIHIGQAGVQMGSALWELYCIEHGVNSDGKLMQSKEPSLNDRIETLFCESNGQYVPRTIFVDLEPTVIDEIKTGVYKNLFGPSCLINGNEDAANNYSRGFYTIGKDKIGAIMDSIRKVVNNCESVSAFQIMHSYAGGTGSGLTSLLLLKLSEAYGKKFRVSVGIFPSSTMSQSTVDPYNSLLHTHSAIEHIDCGILFDNESLYSKAINHLSCSRPTYSLMNRLISQMVTCVFLSHRYRYEGTHHIDVDELLTNLVPYPRIHFPVLSYAPIVGPDQIKHEKIDVSELTRNVFQGDAHFLDCSFENNKYLSCCLLYRGYISPRSVYDAVAKVKCDRKISFVDWCPTGFKLGLNTIPPVGIPNLPLATPTTCLCMVSGNVGIREAWKRDRTKFDLIFNKRAFVHWFVGEGLEEGEFMESREDIVTLENDYEEIAKDTEDTGKSTDEKHSTNNTMNANLSLESKNEKLSQPNINSRKSNEAVSIRSKPSRSQEEKVTIKSDNKKVSSKISDMENPSPSIKNQVDIESSFKSEILEMSNNAFISNNNLSRPYSYRYIDDLDYGCEIEDPSWIEGSPFDGCHDRNILNFSSNNSVYNRDNSNCKKLQQVERSTSYRIPISNKNDSIIHSPNKVAKIMQKRPPNYNKELSKSNFSTQQQTGSTRPSRNIKRSWWRKGPTSANNSGTTGNINLQIDNMLSKMEFELLDKNPSNNSNILSWKDSNPFCKSNKWLSENITKKTPNESENPFRCSLNPFKNETFSSSVSSFIGNGTPSNNSSNIFQCSPFLSTTCSNQVDQGNNFSFISPYRPSGSDSNSDFSLVLPPPPDAEDLRKNLITKCDVISSSFVSENSNSNELRNEQRNKSNKINFMPLAGPTFSTFTPSIPHLRIPIKTKIPLKTPGNLMNLTQSCIFDSCTQNHSKKRNLIISPIESLDCEASRSKQPKLSLINFLYKKFHSSKSSM